VIAAAAAAHLADCCRKKPPFSRRSSGIAADPRLDREKNSQMLGKMAGYTAAFTRSITSRC
jgi:hypothetical protein